MIFERSGDVYVEYRRCLLQRPLLSKWRFDIKGFDGEGLDKVFSCDVFNKTRDNAFHFLGLKHYQANFSGNCTILVIVSVVPYYGGLSQQSGLD